MLGVKERQFQDAITAALGLDLSAFAEPGGAAAAWRTRCRRRTICSRGDHAGARAGSDICGADAPGQSRRSADSVRSAWRVRDAHHARVDGVARHATGRRRAVDGLARHEVAIGALRCQRRRRRADQHQALFQPRRASTRADTRSPIPRRSAGRSIPRRSSRSRSTPSTASPSKSATSSSVANRRRRTATRRAKCARFRAWH